MKELHNFGESAEMYLKSIAELADAGEIVPVTALADTLSISTVSASEMIHKLQARGLVEHQPYKGVRLTPDGLRRANAVLRRHRLWERFLTDQLGLSWEKAYEFACRLEHATDDDVSEALSKYLGSPETCPHGNPIPTPDGEIPLLEGTCLAEMAPGDRGVILRIQEPSSRMLKHLEEKDLRPGKVLCIISIEPFDGPITVDMDQGRIGLGRKVAGHIIMGVE
jgi:DtxR family Mn-dependent transcriptional regulator